jgi:hypothetical protein
MAVRLSAPCTGCCFTPQEHYFYASEGLVRPEGLGKLIKIVHLIGSGTRDLPVCNIGITLAVTSNRRALRRNPLVFLCSVCRLLVTDSCHPDEGGVRCLRIVGSFKSHTA